MRLVLFTRWRRHWRRNAVLRIPGYWRREADSGEWSLDYDSNEYFIDKFRG